MLDVTRWAVVRGHEVFADHADPERFYVLPSAPRIATTAEGTPEMSLTLYAGRGREGGMLALTLALSVSEKERALVAEDLRRLRGAKVNLQPATLASAAVSITDPDGEIAIAFEGHPSPGGRILHQQALDARQAKRFADLLTAGQGLTVQAQLTVEAHRPGLDSQVQLERMRVHDALREAGTEVFAEHQLDARVDALMELGTLRLSGSGSFERARDAARLVLFDDQLESVHVGQWRVRDEIDGPPSIAFDMSAGVAATLRRGRRGDLGQMAAAFGDGSLVRRTNLDDDFFATNERTVTVSSALTPHDIEIVVVELRTSDGREQSLVFSEPGTQKVRMRGSGSVEMRTKVVLRSADVLGYRGVEMESDWRAADEAEITVDPGELAPLWKVELVGEALADPSVGLIHATVRYRDPRHGIDSKKDVLMRGGVQTVEVLVRPADVKRTAIEVHARFVGGDGSDSEATFDADAPGTVVLRRPG